MADKNVISEGIEYYWKGNYTASLSFFLSLSADSGADPVEVAYYIGLCYAKLERYDDALLYLEQVVTSSAEDEKDETLLNRVLQCRYLLAVIYCMSGRKKLADYELNKLLETGYRKASVYASLAYIAWEERQVDKCLKYYEDALIEDENNTTALNGMGYVLACENRELSRALVYCKKALENAPQSAACNDSLGWVYYKMGLLAEAKKYIGQARQLDDRNKIIEDHFYEVENAV